MINYDACIKLQAEALAEYRALRERLEPGWSDRGSRSITPAFNELRAEIDRRFPVPGAKP